MMCTGLAVVLIISALVATDLRKFTANVIKDLDAYATVINQHAAVELLFGDSEAAGETLAVLQGVEEILSAQIVTNDGELFASYGKGERLDALAGLRAKQYFRDGRFVYLSRPIRDDGGEVLGKLYLSYNLSGDFRDLATKMALILAIGILAMTASFGLSDRLKNSLIKPLAALLRTAEAISMDGQYSLRAEKISEDEFGMLTDAFNVMLDRMQESDEALREAYFKLEGRVAERTSELQTAIDEMEDLNQKLKREMAERRIMEKELVQAQKLESIGQLAAGIAHEINTPIQYVGDNTKFLKESFGDLMKVLTVYERGLAALSVCEGFEAAKSEMRSELNKLDLDFMREEIPNAIAQSQDGVLQISNIVRAMKNFSHPGSDKKSFADLNRAIESTATVCRNQWKYVADLALELDPEIPLVECLPGELNQVILNLIVNAADAIGEALQPGDKGLITVVTRQVGDDVEIVVRDDGPGIPDSIIDRVFDPFFTTKDIGKGTGQGLAISHDVIVNKHGGTIDLSSEPGVKTEFTLRIPIRAEAMELELANSGQE